MFPQGIFGIPWTPLSVGEGFMVAGLDRDNPDRGPLDQLGEEIGRLGEEGRLRRSYRARSRL